jgi:hypothetical protein
MRTSSAVERADVAVQRALDSRHRVHRPDPHWYQDLDTHAEAELRAMPERRIEIHFPTGTVRI